MTQDVNWLRSCPPELTRLMRWALADNKKLKRLAMYCGGFNEVIQETWIVILKRTESRLNQKLPCASTTYVINALRWTVYRLYGSKKRFEEKQSKLEQVAAIKPVYHHDFTVNSHDMKMCVKRLFFCALETTQQRTVVAGRMDGKTFRAIGDELKLSVERIRQVESKAIGLIQRYLKFNAKFELLLRDLGNIPLPVPKEEKAMLVKSTVLFDDQQRLAWLSSINIAGATKTVTEAVKDVQPEKYPVIAIAEIQTHLVTDVIFVSAYDF